MRKLPFILLLSVMMFSCTEKSPDCGDPGSMSCELVLVDSLNHYLVGTKYKQDSIKLSVNGALIPLTFDDGLIVFNFAGYDSFNDMNYILKLNMDDSDTLNMRVRKFTNPCWSGYAIDTMKYNKQIFQNVTANRYRIIK